MQTRGPKGHCRSPEYNERERNVGIEPKIAAVSEEKSKISQPMRGQGDHFDFFSDWPEKHKYGRRH